MKFEFDADHDVGNRDPLRLFVLKIEFGAGVGNPLLMLKFEVDADVGNPLLVLKLEFLHQLWKSLNVG